MTHNLRGLIDRSFGACWAVSAFRVLSQLPISGRFALLMVLCLLGQTFLNILGIPTSLATYHLGLGYVPPLNKPTERPCTNTQQLRELFCRMKFSVRFTGHGSVPPFRTFFVGIFP